MSGTMADLAGAVAPAAAAPAVAGIPGVTPAPAPAAAPWYQGKASDLEVGMWQNKGWDHSSAETVALAATKAYNEAQKFIGIPHDEIVRFPKVAGAPEWQGVWDRLGVPKEAAGYDLTAVKFADGSSLDEKADLAFRTAAHKAHVPAGAINDFAKEFINYMDSTEASENANLAAQLETERAALRGNWGANFDANKFVASQGAKALGLDETMINALEKTAGYAKTMEALRRVGVMNKEDKYIAGSVPANGGVMTREQASHRMAQLKADPQWTRKLMTGDSEAGREFSNLSLLISGPN